MAFDAFLKLSNVDSESTDDRHQKWIEVLSFSWGLSQPATAVATARQAGAIGTTPAVERASFTDFTIVKTLDKSSPILMLACANGEHLPSVTIQCQRAEGGKQQYLEIKMTDVLISGVKPGGTSQGSEVRPLEEISFSFSKCEMTYIPQKADGTADASVRMGWDVAKNTKF